MQIITAGRYRGHRGKLVGYAGDCGRIKLENGLIIETGNFIRYETALLEYLAGESDLLECIPQRKPQHKAYKPEIVDKLPPGTIARAIATARPLPVFADREFVYKIANPASTLFQRIKTGRGEYIRKIYLDISTGGPSTDNVEVLYDLVNNSIVVNYNRENAETYKSGEPTGLTYFGPRYSFANWREFYYQYNNVNAAQCKVHSQFLQYVLKVLYRLELHYHNYKNGNTE